MLLACLSSSDREPAIQSSQTAQRYRSVRCVRFEHFDAVLLCTVPQHFGTVLFRHWHVVHLTNVQGVSGKFSVLHVHEGGGVAL
jgi:hypothetical protein